MRPRGSSSTPVNGKIGMTGGSSSKLGSNGEPVTSGRSGKQDRRESPPRGDRERIRRSHRLEEFEQLLARRFLVPSAVAADDLQELVGPRLALARGEERRGELVARLEILGVALDPRLELAITSVQSKPDGGVRPDSSTELLIRGWLAQLARLERRFEELWDEAEALKLDSLGVDPYRALVMLRSEGRRVATPRTR